MTPERWQQIRDELAALAPLDSAARDARLATLGARDPELAAEVAAYLAAGPPESFLASPAAPEVLPGAPTTLSSGDRVGPFEIGGLLGAGGMGQVYRARDTRLRREVAIKLSSARFSSRFNREARAIAALNHPNVCTLYDVGPNYLVMELVEGETLADRLRRGRLPVSEALAIARQIAEALEAAHARGIVHRDLKPGNVTVRADGTAKVLDFGLARETGPSDTDAKRAGETSVTEAGAVLGTASYMSPEQARGETVDARTDIWAFGCVLYELLTGRQAFPGESVAEILGAVQHAEPDWTGVPRLPPLVEAFLKQCLRKAPRDRVHAIADVRLALAGAYDVDREVDAPADAPSPGWRRLVWPAAVVVAALAAFAGARYLPSGTTPGTSASVRQLTFQQGNVGAARFTSDGQGIVYGASWDGAPYRVFTTRLDGTQSRAIDGLPDADLLDVSSRNRLALSTGRPPVDGFLPRGKLAEVDLTGGAPRERLDDVVAADWGPDGELAAVVRRTDEGSWLEFPVGTVVHRALVITSPRVSPDGRHVCFAESYGYLYTAGPGETPEMLVPTVLPRLARCAWSAGGDDILFSYSPTGATHVSIEAVGVNGDNRRVLVSSTAYLTLEDVSANGDVLVTSGTFQYSVRGFAGDRERDLSVFEASSVVHLGAAGRRLLLFDNTAGVQAERLSLRPLDGSPAVGLGALLDGLVLALTSDGERYAFLENEASGGMSTIRLVPTGAGESSTVRLPVVIDQVYRNGFATTDPDVRTADFSDDNRRLLLPSATGEGDRAPRIYVHDFTSERTLPVTPEGVTGPAALSPDGRFVASSEPDGLFVYDVDTGDRRAVPGGPEPGVPARWSATGDVLYLFEQEGAVVTIVARDLRTGARQATREIRVPDPAGVIHLEPWIARSGDAYAYSLGRIRTNVFVIDALVRGAD